MRIRLKDSAEVAHVWAQQSQAEGRCSNMFFDGPSIYSYGRHFEIARFDAAHKCVLFTTRGYSVTTSKHKSEARSALHGVRVFYVHDVGNPADAVSRYLLEIAQRMEECIKARTTAESKRASLYQFIDDAAEFLKEYRAVVPAADAAALRLWIKRRKAGTVFSAAQVSRIESNIKAGREAEKTRKANDARRDAEARAKALTALDVWTAGNSDERPGYRWGDSLPTRLRVKDGRVETSRGAQITERKARELWAGLVRGADVAGVELDNYTVTSWDGAALRVGCHEIARGEIERMAAVLGLPGALPAAPSSIRFECCGAPAARKDDVCPVHDGRAEPSTGA